MPSSSSRVSNRAVSKGAGFAASCGASFISSLLPAPPKPTGSPTISLERSTGNARNQYHDSYGNYSPQSSFALIPSDALAASVITASGGERLKALQRHFEYQAVLGSSFTSNRARRMRKSQTDGELGAARELKLIIAL